MIKLASAKMDGPALIFFLVLASFGIFAMFQADAVEPGIEARVTQRGLQFASQVARTKLQEVAYSTPIPDRSGSKGGIAICGTVDYRVSNMKVTDFNLPSLRIVTKPAVGMNVSARDISVTVEGYWSASCTDFPFSDSGTFTITIGAYISVTVAIGKDISGRPTVHISSDDCTFYAGEVDVTIYGVPSIIPVGDIEDMIEDDVADMLDAQVCPLVATKVNTDIEGRISKMKMVLPVVGSAEVDLSLLLPPVFNVSVSTSHKGEVYDKFNHTESPYPIPTIPSDRDQSKMVFLWLTDYVANSAGYVLRNTGYFRYNVTQDKLPAGMRYSLNTSDLAIRIMMPQVSKLYPNMTMQLNLNATKAPITAITPDAVRINISGDVAAYVIQPNISLTYLFTLDSTINVSAAVGFNQHYNLTWKFTSISVDLQLLRSSIKHFNIQILRTTLQVAMKSYIIPLLNEYGNTGLPVPVFKGYRLQNPVLSLGKGFVKVGSDVTG